MATNGTAITGHGVDEEIRPVSNSEPLLPMGSPDRALARNRVGDHRALDVESLRPGETSALAPLVDRIAFSMARGLAAGLKELEEHIAEETRKVAGVVDRRFDTLQATLRDVSDFMAAQRATNATVEARVEQLAAALDGTDARRAADIDALRKETQQLSATISKDSEQSAISLRESEARQAGKVDSLRAESTDLILSIAQKLDSTIAAQQESNGRHAAALATLGDETKAFSTSISEKIEHIFKELLVHQEDIGAIKESLCAFSTRVQSLGERLDRQADTLRSICSAYSQRERELEQLVDGLARLRSFPGAISANAL